MDCDYLVLPMWWETGIQSRIPRGTVHDNAQARRGVPVLGACPFIAVRRHPCGRSVRVAAFVSSTRGNLDSLAADDFVRPPLGCGDTVQHAKRLRAETQNVAHRRRKTEGPLVLEFPGNLQDMEITLEDMHILPERSRRTCTPIQTG